MSIIVGILACCASGIFFGSMFVAIRGCDPSDGIFAQWIVSIAILCVGFVDFCYQGFPGFYPLAMLGGTFWTIGNATAIPLVQRIGMAIGLLTWNSTKCLTGWVTGRFGMFGMKPNPPASELLNYIGLILVMLGGVMFSLIKIDRRDREMQKVVKSDEKNCDEDENLTNDDEDPLETATSSDSRNIPIGGLERVVCIIAALIAGVLYGLTFVPVIYMIDNRDRHPNYPDHGLSYVFSHFFGIFLSATTIFTLYALYKKNQPSMPPEVVLPSFLGGLLWAIGQTSFFIANEHLSQAISFPIITGLPGCVASLWSILYFKEIKGKQNFIVFSVALLMTLSGAVLVGLSKEVHI